MIVALILFTDLVIGMTKAVKRTEGTEKKKKEELLNRCLGESFECLHSARLYG